MQSSPSDVILPLYVCAYEVRAQQKSKVVRFCENSVLNIKKHGRRINNTCMNQSLGCEDVINDGGHE